MGLVSKANDDEIGLKREGEQIKEIAGTGVIVLKKNGRARLVDDATQLL